MKRLFNIAFVVICAATMGLACSRKSEAPEPFVPDAPAPDYTRMELRFDMGAIKARATESGEQGDKIADVTVWAYPKFGDVIYDNPISWATKHFDADYTDAPLYMELPYDSLRERTYRLVAVLNQEAWGTIATEGRPNAPLQELSENITYTSLINTVFRADGDMVNSLPEAIDLMPVSHWQDYTIAAKATSLTGTMTVYRALAKATFNARLSKGSASDAGLHIKSVRILPAKGISTPTIGYMFSAIAELGTQQNPMPQAFGSYGALTYYAPDITMPLAAQTVPITTWEPNDATPATYTKVGSVFLYENHQGMDYDNSVSTTDPSNYTGGAYYMQIEYEYGKDNNDDMIPDEDVRTGVNYVPLPTIVRNRDYQVHATFDVQLAGAVLIDYEIVGDEIGTVKPWEVGDETELDFTYPTFTVEAVKKYDADGDGEEDDPYYGKPEAHYTNGNDDGAFEFVFRASSPLNKEYSLTWVDSNDQYPFEVAIYKNGTDKLMDQNDNTKPAKKFTVTDADDFYIIKVYPLQSMPNEGEAPSCRVSITHHATWTGQTQGLLINTTTGGTRWIDSGNDRHSIVVTQVAAGQ